nr:transaldolase [uncultured Actinoplanes sp.]
MSIEAEKGNGNYMNDPASAVDGRLGRLAERGVSIWLDSISRDRLAGGGLAELARDSHVVGVTTNPSVFEQALASSTAYDDQIRDLALRNASVDEAARLITARDVRWACDILEPNCTATDGRDGRVSIEVTPLAAHDTAQTIAEARALWWLVDRPNAMIKIPATDAGLAAITAATAEGISVNVTLIFDVGRYDKVLDAYLTGLEQASKAGYDLSAIRSVASFFVSWIDTATDALLKSIDSAAALALRGRVGLANAQLAYRHFTEVLDSPRWKALAGNGAHPQRPLWASTSVKNRAYPDTLYVENLIAAETVNTMTEPTLRAFNDHGTVDAASITGQFAEAEDVLHALSDLGIDYRLVAGQLERNGIGEFSDAWYRLLTHLQRSMYALR